MLPDIVVQLAQVPAILFRQFLQAAGDIEAVADHAQEVGMIAAQLLDPLDVECIERGFLDPALLARAGRMIAVKAERELA